MMNLFVNIKNEKVYRIVNFARRKGEDGQWCTEIAYEPDGSPQIYIRRVEDFFAKFVPHNCWKTANEKQKEEMKKREEQTEEIVGTKGVWCETPQPLGR